MVHILKVATAHPEAAFAIEIRIHFVHFLTVLVFADALNPSFV